MFESIELNLSEMQLSTMRDEWSEGEQLKFTYKPSVYIYTKVCSL